MFKFIKEWFVDPFKEGMEEAGQELKQEKVEKEEMLKEYLEHIETIFLFFGNHCRWNR